MVGWADDHSLYSYLLGMKKDRPNTYDEVTTALEEAMRNSKSSSSSSSPRILKFDLNKAPPSDTDDEAKRRDHKVSGGVSSRLCNDIDLNKSPKEEPPNHDDHYITQNLPNPNPPKRKRRRSGSRLNKAKKQRLINVVLEVKDEILIFEKTLSKSDVNPNQSRFLIPFKKLKRNDFLTQEESSFLVQDEDKKGEKPGLEAFLVVNQRSNKTWGLVFKRWVMKKKKKKKNKKKKENSQNGSLNYVLNRGWNDIVKENNLKAKDKISLWCFRSDGVLCFSLLTRPSNH